jgi:hypothetical protein
MHLDGRSPTWSVGDVPLGHQLQYLPLRILAPALLAFFLAMVASLTLVSVGLDAAVARRPDHRPRRLAVS